MTGAGSRNFTLEPLDRFDDELWRLFETVAPGYPVLCVRDPAYLAWRYGRSPSGRQRLFGLRGATVSGKPGPLMGLVALHREAGCTVIVDLVCPLHRPDLLNAALGHCLQRARSEGDASVSISLAAPPAVNRALLRRGFLPRQRWGFQVSGAAADPALAPLGDGQGWHFTDGDQDFD